MSSPLRRRRRAGARRVQRLRDDRPAIRQSLERGDRAGAHAGVNAKLGVKSGSQRPAKYEKETSLLLLERAMILQALGRYQDASRDPEEAEKHLELLDLTKDTAGHIGKYLYSADVTLDKRRPTEVVARRRTW